ncbi:MAG: type II toxin-antitoxin system HicB family antitoxin [Firmicutes bacterium]|nr:type II toxin-antitoxin system HicB family antitoxin [Bacillota bacterium]
MTITYPAVFRQKEDGSYDGYFPDLSGCRFEGQTLDDARNDAIEAEHSWIELEIDEMEDGAFPDLPFVSHHEDIATGDHEFVQDISVIIHLGVGYY